MSAIWAAAKHLELRYPFCLVGLIKPLHCLLGVLTLDPCVRARYSSTLITGQRGRRGGLFLGDLLRSGEGPGGGVHVPRGEERQWAPHHKRCSPADEVGEGWRKQL